MYSAKEKDGSVLVSISAGGPPTHRHMTVEDAQDFEQQLEEAIAEADG